ncbi:phage tail protein, partial [Porticoccaceae bacterium]|nr:phage tail protein [Porticoccaceae bacterium]
MVWFVYAFTGAFLLFAYLTRVPASNADPTTEEDLNRPTVSQSLSIPVVFGTRGVSAPNVLDSGNLSTVEIKVKQKGLFKSKMVGTGAFKHYLDELHAIAWGPGTLKEIWSGDFLAWSGSVSTDSTISISEENLYGDGKTDGGIRGYVEVKVGSALQAPPAFIENRLGRLQPGMPGVAQAVFKGTSTDGTGIIGSRARGFYFGNAPTFKPIKYVWQFLPNPFSHGTNFDIAGDANPALCLYAMYTNDQWGLNLDAPIDEASFQVAAQTLFDEGLGYSRTWLKGDGKDVEDEILRHANGVRYRHPTTGAITIKLIRDDYVAASLLVLDETNIIGYPEMRRNELSTLATELKVTYLDRAENDKKRTLTLPNLANRLQLGRRNSVTRDFYGASTADLARKISAREGRQVYYPLLASKLVTDRITWDWAPGYVFKMSHSEMGLSESIMRVVKVQRGNLLDGKVALEVVEDVFSYGSTVFDPPISTGTTPLTSEPADVTSFYFMELPVFLIADEQAHQLALFAQQ